MTPTESDLFASNLIAATAALLFVGSVPAPRSSTVSYLVHQLVRFAVVVATVLFLAVGCFAQDGVSFDAMAARRPAAAAAPAPLEPVVWVSMTSRPATSAPLPALAWSSLQARTPTAPQVPPPPAVVYQPQFLQTYQFQQGGGCYRLPNGRVVCPNR